MLANTLTITINAVAYVLPRLREQNGESVYALDSALESMVLKIRNSEEKGTPEAVKRSNMFFEHVIYATPTAFEKYYTVTQTMRRRRTSDPAWLDKVATGFATLIAAQKTAIVNGEV